MSDQKQSERSNWIAIATRLRTPLIVSSIAIIGAIIASVAVFQIIESRNETATRAIEQLEDEVQELLFELAAEDLATSEQFAELSEQITGVLEDYAGTYAEQRGLWLAAALNYEAGNYDDAQMSYTQLAERFPDSYLVAPALASAAAAAEVAGDLEGAAQLLQRLADGEGAPSANQPQALFNLGRIAEQQGTPVVALGHYNRLVDEHPGSNWTNLGRNRILWLTTQGASDAP